MENRKTEKQAGEVLDSGDILLLEEFIQKGIQKNGENSHFSAIKKASRRLFFSLQEEHSGEEKKFFSILLSVPVVLTVKNRSENEFFSDFFHYCYQEIMKMLFDIGNNKYFEFSALSFGKKIYQHQFIIDDIPIFLPRKILLQETVSAARMLSGDILEAKYQKSPSMNSVAKEKTFGFFIPIVLLTEDQDYWPERANWYTQASSKKEDVIFLWEDISSSLHRSISKIKNVFDAKIYPPMYWLESSIFIEEVLKNIMLQKMLAQLKENEKIFLQKVVKDGGVFLGTAVKVLSPNSCNTVFWKNNSKNDSYFELLEKINSFGIQDFEVLRDINYHEVKICDKCASIKFDFCGKNDFCES